MRLCCALALLVLPACDGLRDRAAAAPGSGLGRAITADLWAGANLAATGALPEGNHRTPDGRATIRGPLAFAHPVDGMPILAYERLAGARRQLVTVTQGGAGLGRVLDQREGLPERRFAGDIVFPLGRWREGETRDFTATEMTLLGPALRRITLEIVALDHTYDGVAHSLSYRLTIRDEAGRILECERSVYSPRRGLVAFAAGGLWNPDEGACPG